MTKRRAFSFLRGRDIFFRDTAVFACKHGKMSGVLREKLRKRFFFSTGRFFSSMFSLCFVCSRRLRWWWWWWCALCDWWKTVGGWVLLYVAVRGMRAVTAARAFWAAACNRSFNNPVEDVEDLKEEE